MRGREAVIQDKHDRRDIGAQEAGDDEAEDGVEGGGGADVDEGDEEGDECCGDEGEDGEFGAGFDLKWRHEIQ